jgi:hypothetical protein
VILDGAPGRIAGEDSALSFSHTTPHGADQLPLPSDCMTISAVIPLTQYQRTG